MPKPETRETPTDQPSGGAGQQKDLERPSAEDIYEQVSTNAARN